MASNTDRPLNTRRVDHLYEDPHFGDTNFLLHYGDLTDTMNLMPVDPGNAAHRYPRA